MLLPIVPKVFLRSIITRLKGYPGQRMDKRLELLHLVVLFVSGMRRTIRKYTHIFKMERLLCLPWPLLPLVCWRSVEMTASCVSGMAWLANSQGNRAGAWMSRSAYKHIPERCELWHGLPMGVSWQQVAMIVCWRSGIQHRARLLY